MFWDASAESLGIGTTSPDTPLHISTNVQAVAQLESSHANGSYAIWAVGGTKFGDVGSNKGISGSGNTTDFMIASRSTYPLLLGTGSTERMRIDSSGHVIVKNGGRFYLESSSGFSPFLSESSNNLLFTVNSSEAMRIDANGNVGIGRTTDTVYSGSLQIAFGNGSQLATGTSGNPYFCLLYTSPSPRDGLLSRMPSSA